MRPNELLASGLQLLGLEPSEIQIKTFMLYLTEIKKWNKRYNLTSLNSEEDIVVKHFLDSCLYIGGIGKNVHTLADIGSGAGLPGLPIKIMCPDLDVYLIESNGKKAAFLRHISRTLGLDKINVIEERVEKIKTLIVDAVVTRALFGIEEFYIKASHLLREGGLLVLNKGPKAEQELKELRIAYESRKIQIPLSDFERNIIILSKN